MNKITKNIKIISMFIIIILIYPYIISCKSKETKNEIFSIEMSNISEREIFYNSVNNNENDINSIASTTLKFLITDHFEGVARIKHLNNLIYETYGMNVEIETYSFNYGVNYNTNNDKIALKLLAGDNDFDIYSIYSEFIPYYAKNNACYNLSSTKKIVDNFDYMFDGIREICSVGDKLCGIPLIIESHYDMWDCNIELAEKLEIDINKLSTKKMTWKEFYDFSIKMKEKAETLGIIDFHILSVFGFTINHNLPDYMTNYLDYTNKKVENKTTEYIEYLNIYLTMLDEGLIKNSLKKVHDRPNSALFSLLGSFDYNNYNNQPFPQPLISVNGSYVINSVILAINPNSPNIEAAKKYLEYSISLPILQMRTNDYLLKAKNKYIDVGILNESKTNGHEVVAFMIKNSKKLYYNWNIFKEMDSYIDSLLNRTMAPDEFAQKLYEKSKMIIEE